MRLIFRILPVGFGWNFSNLKTQKFLHVMMRMMERHEVSVMHRMEIMSEVPGHYSEKDCHHVHQRRRKTRHVRTG